MDEHKRESKLTTKALDNKIEKLQKERQAMGHKIKGLIKEIKDLMQKDDNAPQVRPQLENLIKMVGEITLLHKSVIPLLPKEEQDKQEEWFVNVLKYYNGFIEDRPREIKVHYKPLKHIQFQHQSQGRGFRRGWVGGRVSRGPAMDDFREPPPATIVRISVICPAPRPPSDQSNHHSALVTSSSDQSHIITVLEKQNEITAIRDIQVFDSDPLQYHTFIRAFEHSIEEKTDSPKDCYTSLNSTPGGSLGSLSEAVIWPMIEQGLCQG
ncbi:hypothetical protein N1851_018298 [Merluccius polli]|uniref:Uncharacterized protein n=1 Tax=Merluccius polli TaxID=89951 RepID=A0AA47MNA1_MERPO|nr:hypothetical protein N1851_018298 [Merluccius polli]